MTVATPTLFVESIPLELKTRFQWVVWRYEVRANGSGAEKATKVPYSAKTGLLASSTDRRTWSAFEQALEALRRDGYDGIGFVFSADDDYCGVDLDNVMEADGDALQPWAEALVDQLDSYTEITPSGRGLHVLVKAKLPEGRRRRGAVEMYDSGRYFTMTGNHWPDAPRTIHERQAALEAVHATIAGEDDTPAAGPTRAPQPVDLDDESLLERAKSASNGHHFADLWEGRLASYDSHSEADLALCGMLAFWTGGDPSRVDRMFRRSGLYREKWDQRHRADGTTYGQMTIDEALRGKSDFYEPRESAFLDEGEEAPHVRLDAPAYDVGELPALPEYATHVYEHLATPVGHWLRDYVAFARQAAPMTPVSFHEAAALFAISTVVARRAVLRQSTTHIFPNLFLLFVAPSTLYSKTTGFRLLVDLFREAGMRHHLLPKRMTPEAMVQELSLNVPSGSVPADPEARTEWLRERALAARRSWAIDEAHSLFDSFKRDYNTGLLSMMLELYDCPPELTELTIGRGRVTIKDAYLSFFGATTPSSAAEHLASDKYWSNGLWPRFALVTPDAPPVFEFFPDPLDMPRSLVAGLRRVAALFPEPYATVEELTDAGGKSQRVVIHDDPPASSVLLDPGVKDAWEAYTRAVRFDMLQDEAVPGEFFPWHGRAGVMAMKVAMILAAMDAEALPVRVTLPHYARGQQIVERWRGMLYSLRGETLHTQEASERDKVLTLVTQAGAQGCLIRDVYRPLGLKAKETREHLLELQAAGQVELFKAKAANGRKVEMVRRV